MRKFITFSLLNIFLILQAYSSITIKLGYSTTANDPRGIAARQFKSEVEKKTNGSLKIELYDSTKLPSIGMKANDTDLIESIIYRGAIDMTVSSAGNFALYSLNVGISALPFLFSDFEKAWNFMDSKLIEDVNKPLQNQNIVVLAHFDNGFRCVTTTAKEIKNVLDMKGLKIRTPANKIVMETMTALGAKPEPLSFNELPNALKSGRFNAQENPIPVIYNNKLFSYQKYLAITNHSYDAMPLVIKKNIWKKLSTNEKKIVKEAAIHAQQTNRRLVKEQTENLVTELQNEGMVVTTPNLNEFSRATKVVLETFEETYGEELMNKVKAFTK